MSSLSARSGTINRVHGKMSFSKNELWFSYKLIFRLSYFLTFWIFNRCGDIDLKNGLLGLYQAFFDFEVFFDGHFSEKEDIFSLVSTRIHARPNNLSRAFIRRYLRWVTRLSHPPRHILEARREFNFMILSILNIPTQSEIPNYSIQKQLYFGSNNSDYPDSVGIPNYSIIRPQNLPKNDIFYLFRF